eukprot:7179441-Prymnesium_polylepis.1
MRLTTERRIHGSVRPLATHSEKASAMMWAGGQGIRFLVSGSTSRWPTVRKQIGGESVGAWARVGL